MNRPLPNYKVLLFDYDGTICNTHPAMLFAWKSSLEEAGLEFDSERVLGLISSGACLEDQCMKLASYQEPLARRLTERYRHYYWGEGLEYEEVFTGMTQVLSQARYFGFKIAILTNKNEESVRRGIARHNLGQYCDQIYGAINGKPPKPNSGIFMERIQSDFGYSDPASYLMIGDTWVDLLFAKSSCINSCWARYGYGIEEEALQAGFNYLVNSPLELLEILASQK